MPTQSIAHFAACEQPSQRPLSFCPHGGRLAAQNDGVAAGTRTFQRLGDDLQAAVPAGAFLLDDLPFDVV
eukprot:14228237-Alexandrium_andersonii.AAC.1